MPARITKLTDEQTAQMSVWRDKWIAIGLSTERADRSKFEAGVHRCYAAAKLPPPKRIIWVASPFVMALAAPTAAFILNKRGAVAGAVGDAVRGAVRDAVDGAVRGAVRGEVGRYIGANYYNYIGGQFWVGGWWGSPAYVSFFRDVCGLQLESDITSAAQAYQDTCESACWWWPHTDFVVVCERPTQINRDAQGRLHSSTGQAISWPDGWGLHSWHGTTVPAEWIERGANLDPVAVLTHSNVEQRRAGAEIVGWKNILAKLKPRVVDTDYDPQIGTLLEVDLPDAPGERFLQVKCGTGRDFVLPVPREYQTALEANAATYNVPPQLLRQIEVRT